MIAVWGHYHGGNLGDELVVSVIIDAIRRRAPSAQILAVSMAPGDTTSRHGVRALPIAPGKTHERATSAPQAQPGPSPRSSLREVVRSVPGARRTRALLESLAGLRLEPPFLLRSYLALRSVDRLVVAGSGQLLDAWKGPWLHPYTAFRWALLARLAGAKTIFPSVGAGPIAERLSGFLIRKPVEWASFISVRDDDSARVLRAIGVRRELPVCPDMGWAYDFGDPRAGRPPDGAATVGVNVMPHEDPRYWPRGDQARYDAYLEKMSSFLAHVLERGDRLLLFSSQTRADRKVAHDLRRALAARGLADHPHVEWPVDWIERVEEFVDVVSRCDYVVAARFHSVLVPLALGIPTLGLAYHPKTQELLAQVGRPGNCLEIDRFEVAELEAAFERLRAEDGAQERRWLRERAGRLRAAVEAQFDDVLGA